MKRFKDIPATGMTVEQAISLDPSGTMYTFVEGANMRPTHIAAGVLLNAIKGRLPVHNPIIAPSLADALARGDLGVEEPHALKLAEAALEAPAVVGEWGRDHIIIDGAHRLWRRWKRGDATFPAYLVPEELWRHFVVHGVPGSGEFWDTFNRTAQVRTPEMERLARLLGFKP